MKSGNGWIPIHAGGVIGEHPFKECIHWEAEIRRLWKGAERTVVGNDSDNRRQNKTRKGFWLGKYRPGGMVKKEENNTTRDHGSDGRSKTH